jgi:hypothetical protein
MLKGKRLILLIVALASGCQQKQDLAPLENSIAALSNRVTLLEQQRDTVKTQTDPVNNSDSEIPGIYRLHDTRRSCWAYLDLRSDGSGISWIEYNLGGYPANKKSVSWSFSDGKLHVAGVDDFNLEGEDLIDTRANRWLRKP